VAAVPTNGVAEDPRSRVVAVIARHERTLLRIARQSSLCHDDALDAYQRALEIFVRRVETVDPATEVAWLKVVIRHEAMAIRRARSESVGNEDLELDDFVPGTERPVEDVIASGERVRRSAEALRALKPDEAKALMMKAHGLSYEEIGRRNGWTYTKVNRALTEGRKRFMDAYEGIESGAACDAFAEIVEALALGAATAAQLVRIRPHLRHCSACRAAVRDLHLSRARRARLYWPAFLLGSVPSVEDRLRELAEQTGGPTVEERLRELAEPGAALPAPDPAAAAPLPDVGGILHVPLELPPSPGRVTGAKHHIAELFHRAQASDVATGVQLAASGGGGRLATVAAVLGLCLSGAGVGTVCVVSGLVSDPLGLFERPGHAAPPARTRVAATPSPTPTPTPTPVPVRAARAHPTPTPSPTPAKPRARRRAAKRTAPPPGRDPSQGTAPTSHESAPISPAPASASGNETFTPEVPQATPKPAAAPATGGSEFTP
jgi:RNA polymerase sigma factor (sigma-70 family)